MLSDGFSSKTLLIVTIYLSAFEKKITTKTLTDRNWKTEHFQHTQVDSWNRKFPIGSLNEFTHIQLEILCASVPGQLLDHGAVGSRSRWDEISYERDCGHRFSLSGVACMRGGN